MTVDTYGDVTAEYQALHAGAGVIGGQHQVVPVARQELGVLSQ